MKEAIELVIKLAETLHYGHQQGCIHRDIKPANILISADGEPLIADFGVAATFDELASGRVSSSGTLAYMSPEQVSGEVQLISPQTDIHALGVLLFELLTGRLPYQAENSTAQREEILLRQPKRLQEIDDKLYVELEEICAKCLAKHPTDRFNTAMALAERLR